MAKRPKLLYIASLLNSPISEFLLLIFKASLKYFLD